MRRTAAYLLIAMVAALDAGVASSAVFAAAEVNNQKCTPAHECIPYSSYGCTQNADGSCSATGDAPCSGSKWSTACAGACSTQNGSNCNSNIGNTVVTIHLFNFTCGPPGSCSCTAANSGLGVNQQTVTQCG